MVCKRCSNKLFLKHQCLESAFLSHPFASEKPQSKKVGMRSYIHIVCFHKTCFRIFITFPLFSIFFLKFIVLSSIFLPYFRNQQHPFFKTTYNLILLHNSSYFLNLLWWLFGLTRYIILHFSCYIWKCFLLSIWLRISLGCRMSGSVSWLECARLPSSVLF